MTDSNPTLFVVQGNGWTVKERQTPERMVLSVQNGARLGVLAYDNRPFTNSAVLSCKEFADRWGKALIIDQPTVIFRSDDEHRGIFVFRDVACENNCSVDFVLEAVASNCEAYVTMATQGLQLEETQIYISTVARLQQQDSKTGLVFTIDGEGHRKTATTLKILRPRPVIVVSDHESADRLKMSETVLEPQQLTQELWEDYFGDNPPNAALLEENGTRRIVRLSRILSSGAEEITFACQTLTNYPPSVLCGRIRCRPRRCVPKAECKPGSCNRRDGGSVHLFVDDATSTKSDGLRIVHVSDFHPDFFFQSQYVDETTFPSGDVARDPKYIDSAKDPATCWTQSIAAAVAQFNDSNTTDTYGAYGYDGPWNQLFISALDDVKSQQPDFVLMTGDVVTHNLAGSKSDQPACDLIFRAYSAAATEIAKRFGSRVIPVIGNNDTQPKNDFPKSYIDKVADLWIANGWLTDDTMSDDFLTVKGRSAGKSFRDFGAYARKLADGLYVVCIDAVLLLPDGSGTIGDKGNRTQNTIQWVTDALTAIDVLQNKTDSVVWLISHEPLVCHGSKSYGRLQPQATSNLLAAIAGAPSSIKTAFNFAGDINTTRLNAWTGNPASMAIATACGIAPRSRNNPAYSVYTTADKGASVAADFRFLNLTSASPGTWNSIGTFESIFNLGPTMNVDTLSSLQTNSQSDTTLQNKLFMLEFANSTQTNKTPSNDFGPPSQC